MNDFNYLKLTNGWQTYSNYDSIPEDKSPFWYMGPDEDYQLPNYWEFGSYYESGNPYYEFGVWRESGSPPPATTTSTTTAPTTTQYFPTVYDYNHWGLNRNSDGTFTVSRQYLDLRDNLTVGDIRPVFIGTTLTTLTIPESTVQIYPVELRPDGYSSGGYRIYTVFFSSAAGLRIAPDNVHYRVNESASFPNTSPSVAANPPIEF